MSSQYLYECHHTHYMYDIIRSICDNISTLNDIPHCMWHHIHCIYEITPSIYGIKSTLYDITSNVHGTSQPLYLCHHTYSIDDVTTTLCMASHLVYVWKHMHYTWHDTHSLWLQTTVFMISRPLSITSNLLYITSYPLYMWHHSQSIEDIKLTVCMESD